jgi:SWI/SNF-related matrix-associated actin-dependent regulator of chromatin subfamily D
MIPGMFADLRCLEIGPMVSGGHPQNQLTQTQMLQQSQAEAAALLRAKMRSRKPTDKTMPEGIEDCVIGDGVQKYRELRDVERRLDATMMRKRLDIQDSVNRHVKVSY